MDSTLDQKSILIDATPAITLTLGGVTTPDTIAFLPEFMKMTNYSSRYMGIHATAYLTTAFRKFSPESYFQVGGSQLKSIRELAKIFDAENIIPNRDSLPTPLTPANEEEL